MITREHFSNCIKDIKQLGTIKSVAWNEIIDDPYQCSWVRFEDENGFVLKLPCTDFGDSEPEFTLINLALQKLWKQTGEDANVNWIVTHEDFHKIVNKARALKPYKGKKLVNENDILYITGWKPPEYIY
ncbi:MAG: hypothetical protein M0R40_06765 [Firmicutes bacterium]|nr:hypothetical protein [Bacillota bacterium]